MASRGSFRTVVDGETFEVSTGEGTHSLTWVSGPNPGYGFTTVRSDGAELTPEQLEAAIRDFLSNIDPATGYLA